MDFIGEHLGEISAVLAVAVSAYTAWSRRKHENEEEKTDDSRITREFGDSVIKLIQPLNERIDELTACQEEYIRSVNGAITVLKDCRNQINIALDKLENLNMEKVEGTRKIVKEIERQVTK